MVCVPVTWAPFQRNAKWLWYFFEQSQIATVLYSAHCKFILIFYIHLRGKDVPQKFFVCLNVIDCESFIIYSNTR